MAGRIRVGTSSWADPGFVKEWYPPKMPAKERLPWYAQRFELVELNSSFYAVPRRLVLDTAVAARGGWRLMPNIQYPNDRPFPGLPRWEVRGDSVVLSWSNGFTPTIIALRTRGTVLTGEAVALSDAHFIGEPPRPRASVTMRRQPCGPG